MSWTSERAASNSVLSISQGAASDRSDGHSGTIGLGDDSAITKHSLDPVQEGARALGEPA